MAWHGLRQRTDAREQGEGVWKAACMAGLASQPAWKAACMAGPPATLPDQHPDQVAGLPWPIGPILKTLSSPQSVEGFPPFTPPMATARPVLRFRESLAPLGIVKNIDLFNVSAYGAPKDTSRTLQGPQGLLRDLPGPPQVPPRPPKAAPKVPEGSPMPS